MLRNSLSELGLGGHLCSKDKMVDDNQIVIKKYTR